MKGENPTAPGLGDDVQIIRNILFGEHLQQLQERIAALEKSVAELQKENQQLTKNLLAQGKSGQENLDQARDHLLAQVSALEDKLTARLAGDNQSHKKARAELGEALASQIKQSNEKIAANQDKLNNLIAELAQALVHYQQAGLPED